MIFVPVTISHGREHLGVPRPISIKPAAALLLSVAAPYIAHQHRLIR